MEHLGNECLAIGYTSRRNKRATTVCELIEPGTSREEKPGTTTLRDGLNFPLTDNEERLDHHVADHGRFVRVDETGVVRHDDGHVERGDQYQPVPARFEHAVVRQHPPGLLQRRRFVFRERRGRALQQRLRTADRRNGTTRRVLIDDT